MDETPKTAVLRTPRATFDGGEVRIEGSVSGSERGSIDMGTANGERKDKGKERAVESAEDKDEEETGFDMEQLTRLQSRVNELEANGKTGDEWVQRDELLGMVKTLLPLTLNHLPFLQERLAAQKSTIATMQQQAKISEQLMATERERHAVERDSWHKEMRAVMVSKEEEKVSNKRKVLDLDVGYHKELEAANKRLEMDNRLMAPRLVDTQRQIDRLVNELRLLRPHVILNTSALTSKPTELTPATSAPPVFLPQYMPQLENSKGIHRSSRATMGDARTEHLLLAAKAIRSMRKTNDRLGRLTMGELKKAGVVGPEGGMGYKEGYGEQPMSDVEEDASEEEPLIDQRASGSVTKGKSKSQATPLLSRTKRSTKKNVQNASISTIPQTPSKSRTTGQSSLPQTTPGGSNFNDLLRAAEMATRPNSPVHGEPILSTLSATRSTTRPRPDSSDIERGSPKRRRGDVWEGGGSHKAHQHSASAGSASALDLLAQASQLDVASSTAPSSVVQSSPAVPLTSSTPQFGGLLEKDSSPRSHGSSLGAPIDLTPRNRTMANVRLKAHPASDDFVVDPSLQTPTHRIRGSSTTSESLTPARGYASSQIYPTPGGELDERLPPAGASSSAINPTSTPGVISEGGGGPGAGNGNFASPSGKVVPGLGKYWHYTSEMPIKRVRSPYLKWTVEEDELLARAVAIHGEKWDLVSKGVPTRSYHQVRQRWLRKTGAFDKKNQAAKAEREAKTESANEAKSSSTEREV